VIGARGDAVFNPPPIPVRPVGRAHHLMVSSPLVGSGTAAPHASTGKPIAMRSGDRHSR
jgi:hypothetical protein